MTTLQNGDSFLVQRSDSQSGISTNYQVSQENLMANLADDDLLLVQRTSAGISTNYCISGSDLKEDLGGTTGLIRPPVAVLTPLNGSGITEFTQYEPLSSTITAVGEAGTIPKNTDDILSVSGGGTMTLLEGLEVSTQNGDNGGTWPSNTTAINGIFNGNTSTPVAQVLVSSNRNASITFTFAVPLSGRFRLWGRGSGLGSESNSTLTEIVVNGQVSDPPVIGQNNTGATIASGWAGTPGEAVSSITVRVASDSSYSGGAAHWITAIESEELGVLNSTMVINLPKVLNFPSTTNFSGLSVGDEVQTGVTITAIDSSEYSQTTQYSTLNKTHPTDYSGPDSSISADSLTISCTAERYAEAISSIPASNYNNYSEFTVDSASSTKLLGVAVGSSDTKVINGGGSYVTYREGGYVVKYPGNQTLTSSVASYTQGDVIGVAIDSTNVTFYKNGDLQGTYAHGLSGDYYATAMVINGGTAGQNTTMTANFGATAFAHTPPTGYTELTETVTTYPNVTVDGGTWDTSDQSQVWSGGLTTPSNSFNGGQPATDAFDGDLVTFAGAGSIGEDIVFQPTTPVSYSNLVEVYTAQAGQMILNSDSPVATTDAIGWVTLVSDSSGVINTITIDPNSNRRATLHAIRVDGKLLVDAVEDSQVWSNGTYTGTAANNNYGVTDLFANVGNEGDAFGANKLWGLYQATATFTLDNPIPLTSNSTLELITYQSGSSSGSITLTGSAGSLVPTLTVNGTNVLGKTTVNSPYASLGDSITSITIAASGADWTGIEGIIIDGKHVIDAGIRDLGDTKLISYIPYEKSLTFTDDTQLANMVGPLEMVDANGDVVTPVSDTIANVNSNVLTLQGNTNLAYFQPGDEVQTGVQVVSVDETAPSITVDGGSWYGADGTGNIYEISKSLRFNSADSAHLSKTFASAGNRQTWTWSGWVKKTKITNNRMVLFGGYSASSNTDWLEFGFDDDKLYYTTAGLTKSSTAIFRDTSAWQHVVVTYDGSNLKFYSDNVEVLSEPFTTNLGVNTAGTHTIGNSPSGNSRYLDGCLANVHFIDGQSLAPTAFAEFNSNGVWKAKKFDGIYTFSSPNDGTTWSSGTVTGSTGLTGQSNIFDGTYNNNSSVATVNTSADNFILWTPTTPVSYNNSVEIYTYAPTGFSITQYYSVNGGAETTFGLPGNGYGWTTVATGSGSLTSLKVRITRPGSATKVEWGAIKVDGVVLQDGVTGSDIGGNSFNLDFSDDSSDAALGYDAAGSNDWTVNNLDIYVGYDSTNITASTYAGGTAVFAVTKDNILDGTTNSSYLNTSNAYIQFEPTTPINFSDKVEVYTGSNGDQCQVDLGSGYGSATSVPRNTWTSVASGGGTLYGLRHGDTGGAPGLNAIRVDGTILTSTTTASDNDSLLDTPTSNYATFNLLKKSSAVTLSDGNLNVSAGTGAGTKALTTIGMSSGKWYAEFTPTSGNLNPGLATDTTGMTASTAFLGDDAGSWTYAKNGKKYHNDPSAVGTSYGSTYVDGDVIGVAFDADDGNLYFYKNGIVQNSGTAAYTGLTSGPYFFASGGSSSAGVFNAGQRPFAYAAPSGYKALTTANMPQPTIKDGSNHFDVVTFTGSSSGGSFTIPNFEPDLIWCKNRDGSKNHILQDSVRGFGDYKSLYSNLTLGDLSGNNGGTNNIMSVSGSTVNYGINDNFTGNMVAWCWNAGDTIERIDADSLTSSLYNESQKWSDKAETTGNSGNWVNLTNFFNGDLSNYAHANTNASAVEVTVTFTPPLEVSNTVTLYGVIGGAASSATWNVNNEATTALYNDLSHPPSLPIPASSTSFSGSLSSITIERTSANAAGLYLYGIEVDGKLLVDGERLVNTSQPWLDFATAPAGHSSPIANGFDGKFTYPGDLTTAAYPGPSTASFDFAIQATDTVRIRVQSDLAPFFVNAGDGDVNFTTTSGSEWRDISSAFTSDVTSWEFGSSLAWNFGAIELNGAILVDATNDSKTWSDFLPYSGVATGLAPFTRLFDGDLNTSTGSGGPVGAQFTFTIPASVSGSTLSITSVHNMGFQINGGTQHSKGTTVSLPAGDRVITVTGLYPNSATANAVYIDDRLLVDGFEDSQVWSSVIDTTGSDSINTSLHPITKAFNGTVLADGTDYCSTGAGADNNLVFTFPEGVLPGKLVEVYSGSGGADQIRWSLDNATWADSGGVEQWVSLGNATASQNTIYANSPRADSGAIFIAIRVDGKLLVDAGPITSNAPITPSVASDVRANPEAGFSIVNYISASNTASVAHGLNTAPELVIIKDRNNGNNWTVVTTELTNTTDYLYLNTTGAAANFNASAPTSKTFIPSQSADSDYIAYCFASVEGYSAIGSYTGNGSTDGPFVHTGFKPAFLIIKRIDSADHWYMYDDERNGYNPANEQLTADLNHAEYSSSAYPSHDFLSNGFKLTTNNTGRNASGGTYIYMAFAEHPENTTSEVDTSGDTQVALDPLAAIATDILEIDGTTMYLNGATGPWRTGLSIEGSQINAAPPGPNEVTFTSTDDGTTSVSMIDATLSSRTWTLESGTDATGPWTLVDSYTDFDALDSQDGATPWTTTRPVLQPNTYYRIKVRYDSLNADSVESVYNTFKTGDA